MGEELDLTFFISSFRTLIFQFSTRKGYMTFCLNKLQAKTKKEEENETNQKMLEIKPCIFRFIVLVYL